MKISEHIYYYRGGEGLPVLGRCSANTYAIRGKHLTLTDPGPSVGPHLKHVRFEMNRDGLMFQEITKVIVTHAHPDHTQCLAAFMEKKRVQTYAHPLEKRVLEDPRLMWRDEYDALGGFARQVAPIKRRPLELLNLIMFGAAKPASGIIPVKDGAFLNIGPAAEIIGLPGHRPGEIGIYLPEDRALITGDLINWKRYDLPSLNLPLSNLRQAVSSLKKIQGMDIDILAPSHDQVVKGKENIRQWAADALERCGKMRSIAEEEIVRDPEIPLARLGKMLAGRNEGVPPYELRFLAYVVLKSLEPEDE